MISRLLHILLYLQQFGHRRARGPRPVAIRMYDIYRMIDYTYYNHTSPLENTRDTVRSSNPAVYLAPPSPERRPDLAAGVSPLGSAFSLSFSGVSAMSELAMKMPESWRAMLTP